MAGTCITSMRHHRGAARWAMERFCRPRPGRCAEIVEKRHIPREAQTAPIRALRECECWRRAAWGPRACRGRAYAPQSLRRAAMCFCCSSAAGASRTGTWALAHGRKRPRGVVHAALSRARVQPSETLVVERKQVVTAELVRRSRLVQRGMPRRLARGWCLRARRRSPVPAGSRWRRAVASPRTRPSAADEGGRPLPAALHFSSYTAQKALMRP
jgi:hypothetical protein